MRCTKEKSEEVAYHKGISVSRYGLPGMDGNKRELNKLSVETSPYLLQHASNPVNWYPWSEAAIELARQQDKPILLSIGYSACHWCHVMAEESFSDPDIASTMNRLFVNIKVDKEERPDLDKIYQTVHQLLLGRPGGWPLTMFLSPTSLIPYFGGTYFPKTAQEGMPPFDVLLHRLNEVYYREKEKIKLQEFHTLAILQVIAQPQPSSQLPLASDLVHQACVALQKDFDAEHGGFGKEAKFPNGPILEFLLNNADVITRHIAFTTLNNMAMGGLYDHIGGGFFRYTVDNKWQIPHFEKMLYDNAQLLGIYAIAYQETKKDLYKNIAIETGDWLENTLLDRDNGAFFTGLDADSEGKEGLYYLWDAADIKKILTRGEFTLAEKYYQFDKKPNFEAKWHLLTDIHQEPLPAAELTAIKRKLLLQREKRVAPELDRKILTGWNGLAVKGFSIAGRILQNQRFTDLANKTIKFVKRNLFVDQNLYATWQAGKPKILGFLDDYAFFLDGLLEFINNDPNHEYIAFAVQVADSLIANFHDTELGGLFLSSHNAEKLFYRPKIFTDEATASGIGVACIALLRLSELVKDDKYKEVAKRAIYYAQTYLNEAPEIHLTLCRAYAMLHTS